MTSVYEKLVRQTLREIFPRNLFRKRRDLGIINPETNRQLELDFYNKSLNFAIEYNGIQHYKYMPVYHRSIQEYQSQLRRDMYKRIQCNNMRIRLLIIPHTCNTKKTIKHHIVSYVSTQPDLYRKSLRPI
jgi:hypothetical protein